MLNKLLTNSWLSLSVWISFVSLPEIFTKWGWIALNPASDARFSIIVGPQELENGNVVLRDMKDGKEETISLEKLTEDPKSIFNLEML